jgi:hypothetical protein
VTVAGGCPQLIAGYSGVDNPDRALARRMLPPGQPSAGLVCLYRSLSSAPPGAALPATAPRPLTLSAPSAGRLARALAAVRTGLPPGNATAACADDTGATDIIALGYPGRPATDIWYHASGCQSFSNGYLTAYEVGNSAFYRGFIPTFLAITAPAPTSAGR